MQMEIKDSGNIVLNLPGSIRSGPEEYRPYDYKLNNWEAWWAHYVAKGLKVAEDINILHLSKTRETDQATLVPYVPLVVDTNDVCFLIYFEQCYL